MADILVNRGKFAVLNDYIAAKTFKVMLTTSTYVPSADHNVRSDVTNEVVGAGYTAGGQALASVTANEDDANDRAYLDATDPVWSSSSITARYAVIYEDTGSAATDEILSVLDLGSDITSTNADFTLQLAATGWYLIS